MTRRFTDAGNRGYLHYSLGGQKFPSAPAFFLSRNGFFALLLFTQTIGATSFHHFISNSSDGKIAPKFFMTALFVSLCTSVCC